MKKRANVVPELPQAYAGGAMPQLPARDTVTHVVITDGPAPAGIHHTGTSLDTSKPKDARLQATDDQTIELMLQEADQRDAIADRAFAEIIGSMAGRTLDDELLHSVRLRLRRLGDEVYALTRVASAFIDQRQRIRARCKADPVRVCAAVRLRTAAGMTVTDAFIEVGEEFGVTPETIRNAYYDHRHEYAPKRRK
jgi:hypothetical protein